jgi:O-antigen/teichoic acid export membrane protein
MKPEMKAGEKTGLSYELLLFITIAEPFELIAVHFLVSKYNNTAAWILTISSVVSLVLLWVWWFAQRRKAALQLETKTSTE